VIAATPATATPAPVVSPAGTGINQPGINQGTGNGTPFAATLTGTAGSNTTSASASFLLSKDQTTLSYSISVTGPATDVRIRQGPAGSNLGIVLYDLGAPSSGALSGQFEVRPEDVSTLINGGMYLQVVTGPNPNDQISGGIVLASGATAPTPVAAVPTVPATTAFPAGLNQGALQSLVNEIRAGHNAHVATLQQMLGTSAQPAVTFQNLDAPTLTQFLTMAQSIEDFAVGVALNGIGSASPGTTSLTTIASILADDARYAGGIRGYEKVVSTAVGGNPNTTLTQTGQPFNTPVTPAQMNAFLQSYLVASGKPATGTTPGGTTTGATPGGTTTGGTPTGGTTGTGTTTGTSPY
jgi:Ferritin-like domain/CHRD domain